ncbi:MAG TPA: YeeE/YedE family protein [Polyangiales bacterium]|nr:YeeE/YedE family protein [Polyangiales bacterium]
MRALAAALAGLLFAAGLALSGMTSPARVIGFLDVLGRWDPQLVFVMGGAVVTYAVLYRLIRKRSPQPLLDTRYHVPDNGKPDRKLVFGAALFGVGWGLMGLCPGPALVSAGAGTPEALAFVGAMAIGMLLVSLRARAKGDH